MVSARLNGKADPEGSCAEDIVYVGENKGKSYRSDYKRGVVVGDGFEIYGVAE